MLQADAVVNVILNGVRRGKCVIVTGLETNVACRLNNLLGNAVYPIMLSMVAFARRKKDKVKS